MLLSQRLDEIASTTIELSARGAAPNNLGYARILQEALRSSSGDDSLRPAVEELYQNLNRSREERRGADISPSDFQSEIRSILAPYR